MAAPSRIHLRHLFQTALMAVGLVLANHTAFAATLTVTHTDDSGPGSLRQTIADAASGDTIVFDASLDGTIIRLGASLRIAKPLTIDASALPNRITISGDKNADGVLDSSDTRVFFVTLALSEEAVIDSIRMTGVGDIGGAAQVFGGNLKMRHVHCFNCHAQRGGAVGSLAGNGLILEDCEFTDCNASIYGGAVYGEGIDVTIRNSIFESNAAVAEGGAVYAMTLIPSKVVSIANSKFLLNTSNDNSGAVRSSGMTLTISGSEFIENQSGFAGALFAGTNSTDIIAISDCKFIRNLGSGSGGAVYASQGSSTPPLRIEGSHFIENETNQNGGALQIVGTSEILESTFLGNKALNGGAIHPLGSSSMTVRNCRFRANRASRNGGGIFSDTVQVFVAETHFEGNQASANGGAISYERYSPASLYLCSFVNNKAQLGGGVHSTGWVNVSQSTFATNSADREAGIYRANGSLVISQSTIAQNTATVEAGGVYSTVFQTRIDNSIIANNNAPTGANIGGVFSGAGNLTSGDPQLAPLGLHGGITPTMPPLPESPAVNGGSSATPLIFPQDVFDLDNDGDTTEPVPFDQRGFPRISGSTVDIGAVEYDGPRDLPLIFAADGDGDGVPFGVEHALGMDSSSSDLTAPRRFQLGMDFISSQPKLTFGFNTAALPFTSWIVKRSTTLTPEGWTEIYRYHGPTLTETTNGTTATPVGDLLEVTDTHPPAGGAFYIFEASPEP